MRKKMTKLKRELNLWQVTVAGIGIILGAGIYALIGVAANDSGNAIWLAFLISAVVAAFTGLSYAELSSMFKGDAGEYDYIHSAFNKKIAYFGSLAIIFAGIVSAATVSIGFAGYFTSIFNVSLLIAAIGLVILMTLINFIGIKQSAQFNTISTFIEFAGLLLVIFIGAKKIGSVDYLVMPAGMSGVFSAAALVFFAYMGFESIVKLAEETKNPEKTIPKAIVYSVIITTLIYILVSIAAVSVLDWQELGHSTAPLASVVASSLGPLAFVIVGIIALFSTSNTVLITLVTTSRMIYGMAKENTMPKIFSYIHKRTQTPWVAIFFLAATTIAFLFTENLEFLANLTTLFLFIIFALANLSMLILRYTMKEKKRGFYCPGNIGRFSVVALLGFLTSVFMLYFSVVNLM